MKMWEDPIVAEVRRARLEIEKECEEDFALIYARAVEVQKNADRSLTINNPSYNFLGGQGRIVEDLDLLATIHMQEAIKHFA